MNENTPAVTEKEETTIFKFNNPVEMVDVATEIADALSNVIEKQKLYKQIGDKKHVYVEGWTTLGFMTGVFATIEYTKKLEREPAPKRKPEIVYEAKAVAKRADGTIIGTAEAMCSSYETNWNGRDEYAIRSMAQTRAISKALRMPLGWIMTLKGYAATPAEEMDGIKKPFQNPDKGNVNKKQVKNVVDAEYKVKKSKPKKRVKTEDEGVIEDVTPTPELDEDEIQKYSKQSGIIKALCNKLTKDKKQVTTENIITEAIDDERLHPDDVAKIRTILEG